MEKKRPLLETRKLQIGKLTGKVKHSFLRWDCGKESTCQFRRHRRHGLIPGWGDLVGEEMATHSVFLPGKSHGQKSLVGYSPWGCKELNTTESTASTKGKHKVKVGNYLHTNKISKSAIVRRGEHKCMIL